MKKNESIFICTAQNGFEIVAGDYNSTGTLRYPLVFESKENLIGYIEKHFSQAKEIKIESD